MHPLFFLIILNSLSDVILLQTNPMFNPLDISIAGAYDVHLCPFRYSLLVILSVILIIPIFIEEALSHIKGIVPCFRYASCVL